jgi:hypothetical protein
VDATDSARARRGWQRAAELARERLRRGLFAPDPNAAPVPHREDKDSRAVLILVAASLLFALGLWVLENWPV